VVLEKKVDWKEGQEGSLLVLRWFVENFQQRDSWVPEVNPLVCLVSDQGAFRQSLAVPPYLYLK
jgi:hypothetical protein